MDGDSDAGMPDVLDDASQMLVGDVTDDGPADIPEPPATGDGAVDEALAQVAAATGEPLEAQLAAYELAHRALQDRLADVGS